MNTDGLIPQNPNLIYYFQTRSIVQLHLSQTSITLRGSMDTHRSQHTKHWLQYNIYTHNKPMNPIIHIQKYYTQTIDSGSLQFHSSSIVYQWWLRIMHCIIPTELSTCDMGHIPDGCYRINIPGQATTLYTASEARTSIHLMKPLTSTYITILSPIWLQTANDSKVNSMIWIVHTTTHPHRPTHRVPTSITHRHIKLRYGRYKYFFTETSTPDEQLDGRHRQQLLLKHQTNMMATPPLQHTIDKITNSSLYTDSTTITLYGNTIQ